MANGELQSLVNFRQPNNSTLRAAPYKLVLSDSPFYVDFRTLTGSDLDGTPFKPYGMYIDNTQGNANLIILFQETQFRVVCKKGEVLHTSYPAADYAIAAITGDGPASIIFVDYSVEPYSSNLTGGSAMAIWGAITGDIAAQTDLQAQFGTKVDKVAGFGLSQNSFTNAQVSKLAAIEAGAQVNAVTSVAGRTGAITLTKTDVGLPNVDNTSDVNKPVSIAQQAALDLKLNTSDSAFRNLVINGTFKINQRAYVSGSATTSANTYTYDCWKVLVSGQSVTLNASGLTAPAGGVTQIIEGASLENGSALDYTITWEGTATCTVDGVAKLSGDSFKATFGTNVNLTFKSGTLNKVKVTPGLKVGKYFDRMFGDELLLCMRFYQKTFEYSVSPIPASGTFIGSLQYVSNFMGEGFVGVTIVFPVPMITTPTLTFMNPSSNNSNWRNRALNADSGASSTSYGEISSKGFVAVNSQPLATGMQQTIAVHYVAKCEL